MAESSSSTNEGLAPEEQPLTTHHSPLTTHHYLNIAYGVKSWLLTTDHKRIALLYLLTITGMFFFGGIAATLIRLQLLTPEGQVMTAHNYNKAFTAHGVIMVFFFLIPSIPAVF